MRKFLLPLFAILMLLLTACGQGPVLVDTEPTPTPTVTPTATPMPKVVVTIVVQAQIQIAPSGGCQVKSFPKHPDFHRVDHDAPFYEWSGFNPDHMIITYSDAYGGTWTFVGRSANVQALTGLPGGLTVKIPADGYLLVSSPPLQAYIFPDGSKLVQLGEGCNTVRSQNFVLYQTWPDP